MLVSFFSIKIKCYFIRLMVASSIFALSSLSAFCDTTNNGIVDRYYKEFTTQDGTGTLLVGEALFYTIPPGQQSELFAELLDRGVKEQNHVEIRHVLDVLSSEDTTSAQKWSPHLKNALLSLKSDSDWNTRVILVDLLAENHRIEARNDILDLQNDPDDRVRYAALAAISKWPDAESIYQSYIQAHQNDPSYAKAVRNAQSRIKFLHEEKRDKYN